MKITRGFTRKLNLGDYQSADFWASYEGEEETSEQLYAAAKADVTKSIAEYLEEEQREFTKEEQQMIDTALVGGTIDIVKFQELTENSIKLAIAVNEAKKAYKRSPEFKATQTYK